MIYSRSKINQKITENGDEVFNLGILDGLHRCYSFTTFLKEEGNWQKLLASEQKIVLKFFVLNSDLVEEMKADHLSFQLLTLLREYSYQLMTMRKNTVDHTLLDALHKCFKEIIDASENRTFHYVSGTTVERKKKNGDEITTLHVLASKINERKDVLNRNLIYL